MTSFIAGKQQRGFTLMEMVVATTLLSLILVMGYQVLHFAGVAWDKGVKRQQSTNLHYSIYRFLSQTLAQIRNISVAKEPGVQLVLFEGDPQALRFIAPLGRAQSAGGLFYIELQQQQRPDGVALVMRYRRYLSNDSWDASKGDTVDAEEVLVSGLSSLAFSYLEEPTQNALQPSGHWLTHWQGQSQLPLGVKLEMTDTESRQTVLVAELKLAQTLRTSAVQSVLVVPVKRVVF